MFKQGDRLPNATVASMENGQIVPRKIRDIFTQGLYILVGVPGAYTPVCTNEHIPTLIDNADRLRVQGVQAIYCMSDDNPWALESWANSFEKRDKINFLSDGNREFLDKIKLSAADTDIFVGGKYGRWYALIEDGHIRRIRFETSVLKTECTTGECIVADVDEMLGALDPDYKTHA